MLYNNKKINTCYIVTIYRSLKPKSDTNTLLAHTHTKHEHTHKSQIKCHDQPSPHLKCMPRICIFTFFYFFCIFVILGRGKMSREKTHRKARNQKHVNQVDNMSWMTNTPGCSCFLERTLGSRYASCEFLTHFLPSQSSPAPKPPHYFIHLQLCRHTNI